MVRGRPFPRSVARLVQGGVAERPAWLATLEKVPPHFSPVTVRQPPRLVYPEDRLRERFLRENPEAKRAPLNLKARTKAEAHVADRFVAIQMRAMREQGLSEDSAREHAERTLQEATARAVDLVKEVGVLAGEAEGSEKASSQRLFVASLEDAKTDKEMLEKLAYEREGSKKDEGRRSG